MTKLDNDTAPQSGRGSDADRLHQSPQALRHGNKDTFDLGAGEVSTDAGQWNYDKNTREAFGSDPWAAPGSGPTAP